MNKTLHLVRHAKSSWADVGMADFDRPLNDRGIENAPMMAERFSSLYQPTLLVSSDAVRAQSTAMFFHVALPHASFRLEHHIYDASLSELLQVVAALPEQHHEVAMFGHNPGLSGLGAYFTEEFYDMPTCAIWSISFFIDEWKAVGKGAGTTLIFDYPKRPIP